MVKYKMQNALKNHQEATGNHNFIVRKTYTTNIKPATTLPQRKAHSAAPKKW